MNAVGKEVRMLIRKEAWGLSREGKEVSKYYLDNEKGLEVVLSDLGAEILNIFVTDKDGKKVDVLLGYDTIEEYYDNSCGFGAYIGRNANRIKGARVTLDGVEYQLEDNNNGNNLHSGSNRSHYQVYEASMGQTQDSCYVEMKRMSPDMEQDLPGNLDQTIRYTLTQAGELILDYIMCSDKTTVINPTNHSYFNLAGHNSGSVENQILEVYAEGFTPTDATLAPTGEIAPVEGTPMDFRTPKKIGQDIRADYEPLKLAGGYDHNYVLKNDGKLHKAARLKSEETGIVMETETDLCGIQIYSANFLDHKRGKGGCFYEKRGGICFETQFYPNACNEPSFPSSVVPAGKTFHSRTLYRFSVE